MVIIVLSIFGKLGRECDVCRFEKNDKEKKAFH
jgi:hypothetical protein